MLSQKESLENTVPKIWEKEYDFKLNQSTLKSGWSSHSLSENDSSFF